MPSLPFRLRRNPSRPRTIPAGASRAHRLRARREVPVQRRRTAGRRACRARSPSSVVALGPRPGEGGLLRRARDRAGAGDHEHRPGQGTWAPRAGRRYNPLDVWNEAKKIDEWPDTNPGDDNGTSVRAGYDVCRDKGLVRVTAMRMGPDGVPVPYRPRPRSRDEGVQRNRWARSSDEIRTAVAGGLPVAIGVNWYSNFDRPVAKPSPDGGFDHWIGEGDLGKVRGGHSVCIYGASDARQAIQAEEQLGPRLPARVDALHHAGPSDRRAW